jgi:hypothetical protein
MKQNLDIEVHGTKEFSEEERKKFAEAIKKVHKEINSQEFRTRFLSLPLEQTNGMTNVEIYDMLMSGRDKFNKAEDKDIDVYITMYYSWKNVIGYTYPSTWWTWINRKFFSRFDLGEIGGNIVHEYMHNMGFGHRSPSDKMSVPYATGYLIRDMIKERLGDGEVVQRVRVCKRDWRFLWLRKRCWWVTK